MNRKDIIEILKDVAGPLGPFRNIESMEDWVKLRADSYNIIGMDSIECLIDILLNPPGEEDLEQISLDDFEFELVEMLTIVGNNDETNFIDKVGKLLFLKKVRPIIIAVLGGLYHKESIVLLEQLLDEELSEDEIILLADALRKKGSLKAKEILERMKLNFSNSSPEVLREIDICLSYLN